MDLQKMSPHHAVMTTAIKKDPIRAKQAVPIETGFTLIELIVASFIAGLLSLITANLMIENTKSNARAETKRRIHNDWNRATRLIQSEIAMSHSIESAGLSPDNVSDDCPLLQHPETRLQLRMHLVGTMPDVLYGVRSIQSLPPSEANQWMGGPEGGVLIRCGPRLTISKDGSADYIQGTPYQQSVVLDKLDLSSDDGLMVTQSADNQKRVEFSLAMQDNLDRVNSAPAISKTLRSGGLSRINEVPPIPSSQSSCNVVCKTEDTHCGHGVKTLLPGDHPRFYEAPVLAEPVFGSSTICTNRSVQLGDGMQGANGNYVMDGQPTPNRNTTKGIKLVGGMGRNILLGTTVSDTLQGGPDHDGLIGRGGKDHLLGEAGNDSFVPWISASESTDNVTVNGGSGFDRVYLQGPESDYSLSGCNVSHCILRSAAGGTLHLADIEMLVFQSSTKRLND